MRNAGQVFGKILANWIGKGDFPIVFQQSDGKGGEAFSNGVHSVKCVSGKGFVVSVSYTHLK